MSSKIIRSTNGIAFLVDAGDYDLLEKFNWSALCTGGHWHAQTRINGQRVYLHRLILGLQKGDGLSVDHITGDSLDNRRNNLRVCTHAQNRRNSKINSNNSSGYRGVSRTKQGRWRARIKTMYNERWIGVFNTSVEAASAYNVAAIEEHGQYARLNQIAIQ